MGVHDNNNMRPEEIPESRSQNITSFISGLREFIISFVRSDVGLPALSISICISFGLGTTVGIVPEILSDRYARLYHGLQGEILCSDYDKNLVPDACILGQDDAQTGSAWGSFFKSGFIFIFNPIIGSHSDVHGRRNLLIVSMLLMTLAPAVLVMMLKVKSIKPYWFYTANAITGIITNDALFFASLSDNCPVSFRAGRFAMIMAGFYTGFTFAPSLSLWLSHLSASWLSLGLSIMALLVTIIFFPETLITSPSAPTSIITEAAEAAEEEEEEDDDDEAETDEPSVYSACKSIRECNSLRAIGAVIIRPLREMTILNQGGAMRLIALGSFLSAAVYATDSSLIIFYIEEHLNVNEDDLAHMFFIMGILGVILQGIGLQPLVFVLGERGLLVLSFLSGTIHNCLYGVARNKTTITAALSLSQLTKLNYPILSSVASQQVGFDKQGQVQGALFGLNALAGAVGPIIMNYIYGVTKTSNFGPGIMFIFASFLYFLGTIAVYMIPSSNNNCETSIIADNSSSNRNNDTQGNNDNVISNNETGDLEEPLLSQSEDSSII
jgi:DHA1 family tetracycline resistance protein-like MFS transporter